MCEVCRLENKKVPEAQSVWRVKGGEQGNSPGPESTEGTSLVSRSCLGDICHSAAWQGLSGIYW